MRLVPSRGLHPHESVWAFYVVCVVIVDLGFGIGRGHGRPGLHALVHLALLAVVLLVPPRVRDGTPRALARGLLTLFSLPVVFSSLAWILPAIHPEPFEWDWISIDRALFGSDPTVAAQAMLQPLLTELLQASYSVFYFVPMVAIAASGVRGGTAVFERCLVTVVFGFFLSYLGYLLWPTLPPYRFLWHEHAIEGVWLAEWIHRTLDLAEVHRWDCFPSGHTMLSVISLVLLWRHARRMCFVLVPIVVAIVVSTIALRYHYASDVIAGLIGVPITMALADRVIAAPGAHTAQTI